MARRAKTERSLMRIAMVVEQIQAEAESTYPDMGHIGQLVGQAFDIGQEVASIQMRLVAAERDIARAELATLTATLADYEHTIESLRATLRDR